jgi:hypothetical protein
MDLISTLREKIDLLDDGEYVPGLRAVLQHIETAFRHLARGRKEGDETAFTDAIYRTNQAFEGSIKEAFRVLAGKNPDKMKPFEIESYLEQNGVFRVRVLKQFTNYRTEWRNPSTHDYKLDFDESESFLAIVSVTAFACLLLDQVSERLSFLKLKAEAESQRETLQARIALPGTDFMSSLVNALKEFARVYQTPQHRPPESGLQVIGALHGFLTTALPGVEINPEAKLDPDRPFRADFIIQKKRDIVAIEVKRKFVKKFLESTLAQIEHYMLIGDLKNAVLLFLSEKPCELRVEERKVKGIDGRVIILTPINEA